MDRVEYGLVAGVDKIDEYDIRSRGEQMIVLLSGGVESVAVLHKMVKDGEDVKCLYIKDGLVPNQYLVAKWWADFYHRPFHMIDVSFINDMEDKATKGRYVPGQQLIMYSHAFAYAESQKDLKIATGYTKEIYGGIHEHYEDTSFTPGRKVIDDVHEGYEIMQETYRKLYGIPMELIFPFLDYTKSQVLSYMDKQSIYIAKTCSCGGDVEIENRLGDVRIVHCGECFSCITRRLAMKEAGLKDDTNYRREKLEY